MESVHENYANKTPRRYGETVARPLAVAMVFALTLSSWPSVAEDDIEGPAGALPTRELALDGELDAADLDAMDDSLAEETSWESYEGIVNNGLDISSGVRIEDIVEPPADYRYAAFGKPDPFVPPLVTTQDQPVDPLEIPIVSPLQRFSLDELSLVGVWQLSSGERKAMILTPPGLTAGQGIIVKNGDPIGTRGGRILSVGDDFITVREFILAPDGTRQYEDHQMLMGRRPAEDLAAKIRFTPGKTETDVFVERGSAKQEDAKPGERALQTGDSIPTAPSGNKDSPQDREPSETPAIDQQVPQLLGDDLNKPLNAASTEASAAAVGGAPSNAAPVNEAPAHAIPASAPFKF